MSYILDALRRSQAERERGQVPGLNAQAAPAETVLPAPRRGALLSLAGLLIVSLLVVLAVLLLRESPRVNDTAPPRPAAPAVLAAPPAPLQPPANLPMVVSAPPVSVPAPAPPVPTPAAAAQGKASAAPAPVSLASLSPELRRELPTMVIGGSIWSESPASRFVIVNGQVVREGEAAAPGVLLERIGPKAAVLRWREWRIELPL